MLKPLIVLVLSISVALPAAAQTVPQQPQAAAPTAKPRMVKKTVCQRIDVEETTGSRLGSAPKVCKTIEVPAGGGGNGGRAPSANAERG